MKDNVKEFLALRGALLTEKKQLVERLSQIDAALADAGSAPLTAPKRRGRPPASAAAVPAPVPAPAPAPAKRKGKGKGTGAKPAAKARTGKRVRNKVSLRDMALKVTKGNPMTKEQIIEAVRKAGYVFNASDPIPSLNSVLYSNKQFRNQAGRFSPAK